MRRVASIPPMRGIETVCERLELEVDGARKEKERGTERGTDRPSE